MVRELDSAPPLAALATLVLFSLAFRSTGLPSIRFLNPNHGKALEACNDIIASARVYIDAPLPTSAFGEMGNRTKILTEDRRISKSQPAPQPQGDSSAYSATRECCSPHVPLP